MRVSKRQEQFTHTHTGVPGARCCRDAGAPQVVVLSDYGNDVENSGGKCCLGEGGNDRGREMGEAGMWLSVVK